MKKNGLLKILVVILLVISLMTWFIPAGYYQGSYVDNGFIRLGFFDIWQYVVLPFFQSVFIEVLIFILAVGAFYGVLVKTGAYRKVTEKIAKVFKKKGLLALSLIAFVFAALSSFGGYGLLMFVFIPAIISIVLLMGYDKITAFLVTFGAMLIGILGSTYGYNSIGGTITTLDTTFNSNILFKVVLFVLGGGLFFFTLYQHTKKLNETNAKSKKVSKENEVVTDVYLGEEVNNKAKSWPIYTIFGILFVLIILACTKWNDVFGIELFKNMHAAITSFDIGGYKIFSYLLGGSAYALGEWSYFQIAIMLILASLIIGSIYKSTAGETIKNMISGLGKIFKEALLVVFTYSILILVVNSGVFTTLMSYVLEGTEKFNIGITSLIMLFGSALHVELPYLANFAMPYLAGMYTTEIGVALMNVMSQSLYGVVMFVAPTSLFLILGLTYLEIPYKKWLKFSWKLVVELLIMITIVLIAMMLIIK